MITHIDNTGRNTTDQWPPRAPSLGSSPARLPSPRASHPAPYGPVWVSSSAWPGARLVPARPTVPMASRARSKQRSRRFQV